ncbi:hypothetical protein LY76DRAFT_342834 [Colletotrichum caudatum]|nr:hypothetical protein LY76DRAFT_342834 [Colletotrichum caudatum]
MDQINWMTTTGEDRAPYPFYSVAHPLVSCSGGRGWRGCLRRWVHLLGVFFLLLLEPAAQGCGRLYLVLGLAVQRSAAEQ